MEKDTVLHVRINSEDKKLADELYENMGTSLSEATRLFIKQSILLHGFPFHMVSKSGKGAMRAQGALHVYAQTKMRESEREAWIRSLSDKYESLNR